MTKKISKFSVARYDSGKEGRGSDLMCQMWSSKEMVLHKKIGVGIWFAQIWSQKKILKVLGEELG